jgi:hypothetical protein
MMSFFHFSKSSKDKTFIREHYIVIENKSLFEKIQPLEDLKEVIKQ